MEELKNKEENDAGEFKYCKKEMHIVHLHGCNKERYTNNIVFSINLPRCAIII